MDMNRTLHDTNNAQRILKLTADTMLLVDKNGVCIDIDPHCDLWFLQDEILLGKNIFGTQGSQGRQNLWYMDAAEPTLKGTQQR